MTVYVDDVFIPATVGRIRSRWCHLLSDSEDKTELHDLAARIGLHREWFQEAGRQVAGSSERWWRSHYDVTEGKRLAAIAAGAVPISSRDWAEKVAVFNAARKTGSLLTRMSRIAEAHSKAVDSAGGTGGDCVECGWAWPCPTYVWATEDRDVLKPWNPADDEETADA